MDCLFPSKQTGAAIQTIQSLAALAPVAVPGSTVELRRHAPNVPTEASAVLASM